EPDELECRAGLERDPAVALREVNDDVTNLAAGARGGVGERRTALVARDFPHDLEAVGSADPNDEQRPVVGGALDPQREQRARRPYGRTARAETQGAGVETTPERGVADAPG